MFKHRFKTACDFCNNTDIVILKKLTCPQLIIIYSNNYEINFYGVKSLFDLYDICRKMSLLQKYAIKF